MNAFLNSLQSLLNLIFPLITFPYVSRVLSVDGMGKYNFANSIVSYFLLLAALGISTYAVREGAKLRDDRKAFSEFASKIFTINLVSTLISYILLFVVLLLVPVLHQYLAAILILSISIFFTTIGTDWVYTIYEEYAYITVRNIVFKIISIVMMFVFVRHSGDYLNYVIITMLASTGSYVLNFFHAKKLCDLRINWHFDWKTYLTPILVIFGSTVAVKVYVSTDTTIIGFMKGNTAVALYSTSTKIYQMVAQMLSAVLMVTVPRLAMLMGQNRMEEYKALLKNLIDFLLMLVLPGVVGLFFLSKDIILIISSAKYSDATLSLRILSFALLGNALATIFNQCALIPAKREKKTLISSTTSAIFNLVFNLILVPFIAQNGAALTTVASEFIVMFMNYYYSRDITGFVFKDRQTIKNIAIDLLGCVAVGIICVLSTVLIDQMIIRDIVSVILSVVAYSAILLALKHSAARSVFESAMLRFK